MKIDFSYIINLGQEYNQVCQKFWKINEKAEYQIPFFVFSAVNGKKLSELTEEIPFTWSIYQQWALEDPNKAWWNRPLTPGELGCSMSHYWVWKSSNEDKVGNVLFLEEDFVCIDWPTEDEWNAIPEDWDMIYLGRSLVPGHEDTPINEHVVRVGYSYNMHAYILSPEGLRKVMNTPFLTNLIPTDEFMPAVIGVHPREDITTLFHLEDFNAYAFGQKNFVVQESSRINSQTEYVSNIRDIRDWDHWLDTYLNPGFRKGNFQNVKEQVITQGGVLEFPLFSPQFCEEFIELMEHSASKLNRIDERQYQSPLNNLKVDFIYHRILRDYIFPFLDWYWEIKTRGGLFASKSSAYRYGQDSRELKIIHEHESVYCMALRLSQDERFILEEDEFMASQPGNVIIHPTILTHNYEGKKFVYDPKYCILSFF